MYVMQYLLSEPFFGRRGNLRKLMENGMKRNLFWYQTPLESMCGFFMTRVFHELFEDLSTVRWCWVRSCCCVPITAVCLYNFFLFPNRNSPICVNSAERKLIQHRCFDELNVWSIDFEWGYRCGLYKVHNDGVSHRKALTRVLSVSVLKCVYKVFSNLFKKKWHVMKWVLFSLFYKVEAHWPLVSSRGRHRPLAQVGTCAVSPRLFGDLCQEDWRCLYVITL